MLLGKIFGKVTTTEFKFQVTQETKKFEYVQVYHPVYEYVLCQILEIEKHDDMTTAFCQVIGFKDKEGKVKKLKIPFQPGSEVFLAEEEFIGSVIKLESSQSGAYLGKLDGKDIPVLLDLKKLLTKHVAILAKSGSGKSYTVGVLLEEIIEKGVPLIVIDPHGEYPSMKHANTNEGETLLMAKYGVKPKGFSITEYGNPEINLSARPIRLADNLSRQELINLLPVKLSAAQLGVLHNAMQQSGDSTDIDSILYSLQAEESNAKWNVISVLEQLKELNLFSPAPTPFHELVKSGNCSVLNFRGVNPDIQEIIVYKLCKDLFELRKQNKIPPFFMVIEEAHNYCPERSFGETKSSKILRTIASEGRKFGLGLCVVSQRPARVDKSVLSQCSTQIIMKLTNPQDLKAMSSSVEGITSATEREIQELPIGTAVVTGVTDVPLFVNVRPRKSMHGGHAVDILSGGSAISEEKEKNLLDKIEEFKEQEVLAVFTPHTTVKDVLLMSEKPIVHVHISLVPVLQVSCEDSDGSYKILVDLTTGSIITDKELFCIDQMQGSKMLPALDKLSKQELQVLHAAYTVGEFKAESLVQQYGLGVGMQLESLLQKGLLQQENGIYKLSQRYIFSKLSHARQSQEPEYTSIQYESKQESVLNIDSIITKLQKFTTVSDHAQGFFVCYQPIYK